jgi:hypothetical protein
VVYRTQNAFTLLAVEDYNRENKNKIICTKKCSGNAMRKMSTTKVANNTCLCHQAKHITVTFDGDDYDNDEELTTIS